MTNQITTVGSAPILLAGATPAPVAARLALARTSGAPVPRTGSPEVAMAQVNQHLQQAEPQLKLQVDAGSGRTVYQVVQQGTGEVVLQVPSAEVLGMSRRVRELEAQGGASGALVDQEG
jgi:FlaG protein